MEQKTMLLVDDAEINLVILEGIFKDHYKIRTASNGVEALEILRSEDIDIVILDIVMPKMDGFTLLEVMKNDKQLSDIPVVMATSDGENEERALSLGADDFIIKPYSPVVVHKRIENIMVKHVLEQQKLREALMESREDFKSLADSVPGGISVWKVTDKLVVQYYNNGLCELLGCTREEFIRDYAADLSRIVYEPDYKGLMELLQKDASIGRRLNLDYRIRRKDGGIRWFNLSAIVFKMEDNKPLYRAVNIDVTKNKENELLVEQRNIELSHMLEHDVLTGIYNRYGFTSRTARFLKRHSNRNYVVMQIDIERFKVINELYGNEMGDRILCLMAESMKEYLKEEAIYGRLEADHFVICLPDDEGYVRAVREFLMHKMKEIPIRHNIALHFGIYPIEDKNMPVDVMCDRASLSLYSVKGKYNQNYAVFDEKMHKKLLMEQEMFNEMELALQSEQFKVYIQPIVSMSTGKIVSAEALVRWYHPEKGMISPGDFIPFFEGNGFIVKLDAFVREKVISNLERIPLSVNISRLEFYDPDFRTNLEAMVEKYKVDPAMLRLEVTESAYADNPAQLLEELKKLRAYGFKILMDDFGSGYSSLNMLKEAPVDILKLDMKFLSGRDEYDRERHILASMVHLATAIGMKVVAEGIETEEQVNYLKKIHCEYGQGYYYARPMPLEEFKELEHRQEGLGVL